MSKNRPTRQTAPARVRSQAATEEAKPDTGEQATEDVTDQVGEDTEQGDSAQDGADGAENGQQGEPDTAEQGAEGTDAAAKAKTGASEGPKAAAPPTVPAKKHWDSGRPSTAPEKPKSSQRPYLESPRPFGIHMKDGILRSFNKGRNLLKHLTPEQVQELKDHSYVADNGAEVID